MAYDIVRLFEKIPANNPDETNVPDLVMLLATDFAVLDHVDGSVWLIANAVNYDGTDERVDDAYQDAVTRLDAMQASLNAPQSQVGSAFNTEAKPQFTNKPKQKDLIFIES
jgi:anthranilate synthase component 1